MDEDIYEYNETEFERGYRLGQRDCIEWKQEQYDGIRRATVERIRAALSTDDAYMMVDTFDGSGRRVTDWDDLTAILDAEAQ